MQVEMIEPEAPEQAPPPALLPPPERAALALNTKETEARLRAAVDKHKGITEIKDKAGREQAHGAAMELMRLRTDLKAVAKEVRDDATKFSKAVIAEEDRLVEIVEPEEKRLKALRDAWDAAEALRKQEEARIEAARKAVIADRIARIKGYRELAQQCRTSAMVQELIAKLTSLWENYDVPALFEEFADDAGVTYRVTLTHMEATRKLKADAEAEAARLKAEREAEAERQRVERERIAEERRQQEAEAARLAAEREAFERERAAFAEQKRLADEKAAWDAKWGALHPNGAPMYSRTTFKDNGDPIMLDADGKRSVFCDVDEGGRPAETMVDLGEVLDTPPLEPAVESPPVHIGVDLVSGPDMHIESALVHGTAWVRITATADGEKTEHIPASSVLLDEAADAEVIAGFDEAMAAPLPVAKRPEEAPPAEHLVTVIAQHYDIPASLAIDWLVTRADDIINLND